MCSCATKRKIDQKAPPPVCSEGPSGSNIEAPKRQMARLPQEEVDEDLSREKHAPYPNLDDRKPDSFTSLEDLEELRELYRGMIESYESYWASFTKYQC
jgi:hypothetical protein